jgi:hypothetical protein
VLAYSPTEDSSKYFYVSALTISPEFQPLTSRNGHKYTIRKRDDDNVDLSVTLPFPIPKHGTLGSDQIIGRLGSSPNIRVANLPVPDTEIPPEQNELKNYLTILLVEQNRIIGGEFSNKFEIQENLFKEVEALVNSKNYRQAKEHLKETIVNLELIQAIV